MTQSDSNSSFTGSFSHALKAFDQLIKEHDGTAPVQLLCNRAFCYEKLQLNRKALKVGCLLDHHPFIIDLLLPLDFATCMHLTTQMLQCTGL
jgi:hypothetical protein